MTPSQLRAALRTVLRGEELTPAAKRFIIELHEKCTNRKLL